jgi:hypothetical protein
VDLRQTRLSLLLVMPLLGCGNTEATKEADPIAANASELQVSLLQNEVAHSGSRLTAQLLQSSQGLKHFFQMHDSVLNTACNFAQDQNGDWRCVPEHTVQVLYADPGCTQPIIQYKAQENVPPPPYQFKYVNSHSNAAVCDAYGSDRYQTFEVGALTPVAQAFSTEPFFPGVCHPAFSFPIPGWVDVSRVVTPVAPSALVGAQVGLRFSGGYRLFEKILFGNDGSRSPMNLSSGSFGRRYRDLLLNTDVTDATTHQRAYGDRDALWVGSATRAEVFSTLFADASCTKPAIKTFTCGAPSESVGEATPATVNASCELESSFRSVKPAALSSIYETSFFNPTCSLQQVFPGPSVHDYALGPAINPNRYLKGSIVHQSFGRLSKLSLKNQDGSQATVGLYDETLDVPCSLAESETPGSWRCYPQGTAGLSVAYSDPACTQQVLVKASVPPSPFPFPSPPAAIDEQSCFTGKVRVINSNPDGSYTSLVRGTALSATPVPTYNQYGPDCFPGGEGMIFAIASQRTAAAATLALTLP